jgi:C-1 hydroxylase
MSTEENKVVVRRFIAAFERHDMEALWENFDPRCRFTVLTRFGIEPTFENYKQFITSFAAALPDVHHVIEDMVAEGEKVWVNYTIQGTHEGLLRNVPATHKQVSYSLIAMYRVAGGKIVEADFQSDDLSLLRQLGALPL